MNVIRSSRHNIRDLGIPRWARDCDCKIKEISDILDKISGPRVRRSVTLTLFQMSCPIRLIAEECKMMNRHKWAQDAMSAFLRLGYLISRGSELNEPVGFDLVFAIVSGTRNP